MIDDIEDVLCEIVRDNFMRRYKKIEATNAVNKVLDELIQWVSSRKSTYYITDRLNFQYLTPSEIISKLTYMKNNNNTEKCKCCGKPLKENSNED